MWYNITLKASAAFNVAEAVNESEAAAVFFNQMEYKGDLLALDYSVQKGKVGQTDFAINFEAKIHFQSLESNKESVANKFFSHLHFIDGAELLKAEYDIE